VPDAEASGDSQPVAAGRNGFVERDFLRFSTKYKEPVMTQAAPPPPVRLPPTDPLAIWALVLGIVNLLCCIPFVPAILAIVLGGRSKEKIRASGGTLAGEGTAHAAVIIGWIGVGLDVLGCIISGIIAILYLLMDIR
jgi:thiol:disulfide interchange protein